MVSRARVVMRTLITGIRLDRTTALIVVFIIAAQAVSTAAVATTQRWIVDHTGLGMSVGLVIVVALGAAAYAASAAGNRIQANLRNDLSERVDLALHQEVLSDIARIPTIDHLERKDFLDRFALLKRGTQDIADASWTIAEVLSAVVSLVLSVWLLGSIHPALIMLAVLGVPSLIAAQRGQRHIRQSMSVTAEMRRHEQQLHELCVMPGPATEVRLATNGQHLSRRADDIWAGITRAEVVGRMRAAAWQFAGWSCFGIGFIATFVILADLAAQGRASLGDIALVVMLASRLRIQISVTVNGMNQIAGALHAIDQYIWLREYAAGNEPSRFPIPDRLHTGIALTDVRFSFAGSERPALRDINLTLRAGSTVGVVGVNGAGKSTLIKILTGMHRPTGGSITLDGVEIDSLASTEWAARVSGTFQDFAKLQFPCYETIGVGDLSRIDDHSAIEKAVERGGATQTVQHLPEGLRTQLGLVFGGQELSHGQWQKLALSRGLMRDRPALLVLDEPTAALDPQAEHELFENFFRESRSSAKEAGTITVVVSHRFSTVHNADHIVVISDGTVIEEGSHSELMAANGHYASLYRTQALGYA